MSDEQLVLLTGTQPYASVGALVEGAMTRLVLVSPYLGLGKMGNLRDSIGAAAKRADVVLVGRDDRGARWSGERARNDVEETVAIAKALGFEYRVTPNLHAKVYWSERSAILTSLNLLSSSVMNSVEVGLLIPAGLPLHADVGRFVEGVVSSAEVLVKRPPGLFGTIKAAFGLSSKDGYCLGCACVIPYNLDVPVCDKHTHGPVFYCHACGKSAPNIKRKVQRCGPCYHSNA